MILRQLDGVPHVVQLMASEVLAMNDMHWSALLLQPYGRLLEHCDAPSLIAQVAHDVAQAISDCARKGIMHRDITPGNFVEYQQHGYLCDFNAAKEVPCGKISQFCWMPFRTCACCSNAPW